MTRALPLVAVGAAAFAVGALLATGPGPAERALVRRYVRAWARGDYRTMYALLDRRSRSSISAPSFRAIIRRDAATATETALIPVRVYEPQGGVLPVKVQVRTRLFGTLTELLQVPVRESSAGPQIRLTPTLLFPGLRPSEDLRRNVTMPTRASLLADDGTPLAAGPSRASPIPTAASAIVGALGPIPAADRGRDAALGYPPGTQVGQDGLEAIFQRRLAGRPGGTLLAGRRVLASTRPVPGRAVKTTIDPTLELAAISAMGGNLAGIVAMNPRTGGLEALAGIAYNDVQPPGSTMKIITSSAALTAGLTTLGTVYPYASSADIGGYILQNAGLESCGGTLINAFAVSCNSVFAPLGVKVGAQRLVAMAERYGFDRRPPFPLAYESTIPSAATIGGDTAVGSSAIGQGMVQASPLEMTDVAATIANGGRRPIPTLAWGARPRFVDVISPAVAADIRQMMIAVVQYGTGTPAQISGVEVAGKTGTAELRSTQGPGAAGNPSASAAQNTDSWFVAFAPAGDPKVAVGALFPNQGAGATTAAPAVRQVLEAALAQH
jgi:cell division protein FtsI/penicillin-binding protein 2